MTELATVVAEDIGVASEYELRRSRKGSNDQNSSPRSQIMYILHQRPAIARRDHQELLHVNMSPFVTLILR